MNKTTVKKKVNLSQNEGLSPSFDGFGSISLHSIWVFRLLYSFHNFFSGFPTFFAQSTTEETKVVEMRIWCIKIGIVLVLHGKKDILDLV
jgi:hypothetical protein